MSDHPLHELLVELRTENEKLKAELRERACQCGCCSDPVIGCMCHAHQAAEQCACAKCATILLQRDNEHLRAALKRFTGAYDGTDKPVSIVEWVAEARAALDGSK